MVDKMKHITKEDIKKGLKNSGLKKRDLLVVHSSLSSMGYVEGGADTVIDAIIEVIGKDGTLMMPTFTYSSVFYPQESPSQTGRITETLLLRKDAIRSWHPTHSVAAIGRDAEKLTADHIKVRALGKDSPIDRLAKKGGYVLLLGVDHTANSAIHVGEAYAEVPYLDLPYTFPQAVAVNDKSNKTVVKLFKQPGCGRGFGKLEKHLRARGLIKDGMIGNATVQLIKVQDLIDTTVRVLKDDPAALLCDDPVCTRCRSARERMGNFKRVTLSTQKKSRESKC